MNPVQNLLHGPNAAVRVARDPHVPKYIPLAAPRTLCLWGARYGFSEAH